MLGMLVVGGLGTSLGPILGATLIVMLHELATELTPIVITLCRKQPPGRRPPSGRSSLAWL
jgi:ABC-type branched-subunit amino acid transport system permease subunit